MILAAALLVLIALGLFIAGLLTGVTVWYWACVAVSALAAVLLIIARRQISRPAPEQAAANSPPSQPPAPSAPPAAAKEKPPAAEPATASAEPAPVPIETPPATPRVPAAATPTAATPATPTADVGADGGDPPAEEVEVTDLLLVVDMHDDVFVVDEHPRYHLADCSWLAGRETIPLPVDEARTDGFTPCGVCSPDRHLAQVARARKAAGRA